MVDSIGPNKISAIIRNKAVTTGRVDKSGRDKHKRGKDGTGQGPGEGDKGKKGVGANIDEHC